MSGNISKKSSKQHKNKKSKQEDKVNPRFAEAQYDPTFQKISQVSTSDFKKNLDSRFTRLEKDENFSSINTKKYDKTGKLNPHYKKPENEADESSEEDLDGDLNELLGNVQEEYDFLAEEENVQREEIDSKRLAMMNYDWEKLKVGDIYVTFSSFLPAGGELVSVKLYPSDFGEQMMKEEMESGPQLLQGVGKEVKEDMEQEESDNDNESSENGSEVEENQEELDINAIRKYELDRLKFYYAVIEFDSTKTADYIYANLNDFEIESTGNKIDLRAIPDDLKIPKKPVDICKEKPSKVSSLNFLTKARSNTKVEVTWEKPEKGNKNSILFEKDLDNDNDIDIRDYIASDDMGSEGEDSEEDPEEARAQLLGSNSRENVFSDFDKSKKNRQIDVQFKVGFDDESEDSESETDLQKKNFSRKVRNNKLDSDNEEGDAEQTTQDVGEDDFFEESEEPELEDPTVSKKESKKEKFRKKLKQKKKKVREEELQARDKKRKNREKVNDEANLNLLTKRDNRKNEDDFEVNLEDDRFGRLFNDRNMPIDPTNPHFKKDTAGKLLKLKKKNRKRVKV